MKNENYLLNLHKIIPLWYEDVQNFFSKFVLVKKLLLIVICFPILIFGQQSFTFLHDGLNRDYIYYSPNNLALDAPLVSVAHGFTQSAQGIMSFSGMNAIADQNGFAVCYPQGTTDSWGNNFWNVGYDFHSGVTVDDIDFLESLASFLQGFLLWVFISVISLFAILYLF